jgi:kynurenine formamidase
MPGPSEQEFLKYFDLLSNWGRWGEDDQLGTLNLITPEKRAQAAAAVTDGEVIECGRGFSTTHSAANPFPMQRYMLASGDAAPATGMGTATEFIALKPHGTAVTHLDALSHFFWNGKTYNGRPSTAVSTANGAEFVSVEAAKQGMVSRGVFLDMPRSLGVEFLGPGYEITPEELEQCEEREAVEVEPGDILVIRTGRDVTPSDGSARRPMAEGRPGLRADCLPWLHNRSVSVLACDIPHDVRPSPYPGVRNPVHAVALTAMGLWLIDNVLVERLSSYCEEAKRWSFLFTVAPLPFERSTSSPVNPLALF